MEEIRNIKETQEWYADQYVKSSTARSSASSPCFSGDLQDLQLKAIDEAIQRLEGIVDDLAKIMRKTERDVDDLEQYGRRNCLVFHGTRNIPTQGTYVDFEKFVLNRLNCRLKIEYKIKPTDIDTCHILPSRNNRPAPIIIKFVRRSIRDLAHGNKKRLKDENNQEKLSITESLTRRRLQLLTNAKDAFGFRNVWTVNDNVYTFHKNRMQVIDDFIDIDRIFKA